MNTPSNYLGRIKICLVLTVAHPWDTTRRVPLISRDAAELASTQPIAERTIAVPEFSTEDTLRLRAWGVKS